MRSTGADTEMKDVPFIIDHAVQEHFPVHQACKAQGFQEYFRAHPQVVEGAGYFGNAEATHFTKGAI